MHSYYPHLAFIFVLNYPHLFPIHDPFHIVVHDCGCDLYLFISIS